MVEISDLMKARDDEILQAKMAKVRELSQLPIPDLVERYKLQLHRIGEHTALFVGDSAQMEHDGMTFQVMHMSKEIGKYLRESGAPVKFTPTFAPSGNATESKPELKQNVVRKQYRAQYYNANGCLIEQVWIAESLDAATMQAAAEARRKNLALHDVQEVGEILPFPGKPKD